MAKMTQRIFGRTPEGDEITQFALEAGSVSIELISYGATLSSVRIPDRHGHVEEVALGFDTLEGYLNPHPYFGATLGRVANRIGRGRFTIDGKTFSLFCNDGRNHLHGGKKGFDRATWLSAAFQRDKAAGVAFFYASPDGEEGYPGNVDARVIYTLEDSGALEVKWEARTDRATIVNLSNHAYWNLKGAGSGDILDHVVTLDAQRYIPSDKELIPTGEIRDVAGTPYDFRQSKPIRKDIDKAGGGFDSCFVLGNPVNGWRKVGTVHEPSTGRGLEMFATQPGVHFYSGHMMKPITGRAAKRFEVYGGFALETEAFPDAINQKGFPNVILRPGETYTEKMRIRFFAE
ncbi:MAG TPA: aldose epimerase family protein [Spirochaetia bacterium]|nr:aldose epimerase family protein [Spirochaetia bacterium]